MDVDFELAQDFIFLLELCKDPENVFAQNSADLAIARTWLDKLSRYDCTNLDERRLRNVYMSHLIVCLNEGKMTGPFAAKPNLGKLEPTDFTAKSKVCTTAKCSTACGSRVAANTSAGNDSFPGDPPNAEDNECHCNDRPCKCCKCKDNGNDVVIGYVTQHVKTPACMNKYETIDKIPQGTTPSTPRPLNKSAAIHHERPTPAEFYRLQERVRQLLEAIAAELRSEVEPGSNDLLEFELSRYNIFIKNYSTMAIVLERLQSKRTLRSFLLLNLQKDLVKLLNDTINSM